MNKFLLKSVKTLAVLSSLTIGQSYADVLIVGNQGEVAINIANHFKQKINHYSGQQSATDLLYVDAASATTAELDKIRKNIIDNKLVVLDLSGFAVDDMRVAKTKYLTGLGVSAPVVIMGLSKEEPITNLIENSPEDENTEQTINQTVLDSLTNNFDYKG